MKLQLYKVITLTVLAAVIITVACKPAADTNATPGPEFDIGYYKINPSARTISVYTPVGGENWDGYTYVPLKGINYNTTTLLLFADFTLFKESFPFPFHLPSLQFIHRDANDLYLTDKGYLYHFNRHHKDDGAQRISLNGFRRLKPFVYTRAGRLYYTRFSNSLSVIPVDIAGIDSASFTHLAGDYYYDKHGLYRMGGHSYIINNIAKQVNESALIAKATGPNMRTFANSRYFRYGNNVFGNTPADYIEKLTINADKMQEVPSVNDTYFLTDGYNVYADNNYYTASDRNSNSEVNAFLGSGITLDYIFPPGILCYHQPSDTAVVHIVSVEKRNGYALGGVNVIVRTGNNYYITYANSKPLKLSRLVIFNGRTGHDEDFQLSKFRPVFTNEIFVYDNVIYFAGYSVANPGLNLSSLHNIAGTNYITDGKMLIYAGPRGGISLTTDNGAEAVSFADLILPGGYSPALKIINEDLLTDGNRLISKTQETTIKALGLNIKALPNPQP